MRRHHCENTERPKPPVLLLPDSQGKVWLCSPSVQPSRNHRNEVQPTDEPTVRYTRRSVYGNQRAHTPFETDERPPLKAGMASHSVYTEDFQAWDSPARVHPFRPRDNLSVNRALFATATTSRDSFCPPGPPASTREGCRPAPPPREAPPFDGTADHSSQYRPPAVWPRRPPARLQPQTREYRAPLLSTTRAHFGEHRGLQRPPGARPAREASVRSSVRSTMKEDFRAPTTVRRLPVAPPPQELEWPRGPFARTTTACASYTPKAAPRSLSCKPRPRPLNTGPPMEKDSVYMASFTAPRGPVRDGAPPRGHGGVMDVRLRDRRSADAISNEPA
ncbi:uncharacterized protein LOC132445520 isoform X2 [Gadus macrocephalus]|uniref:uncharacterized protein LOC132445520 isoform X2 n=1 Tax=Gadus macrocephalus TaxID=80720 RepID=UPI0028CBB3B0|nr:uncharacterized protein LOC132445520 isoform X2 [Gadus macrocephalus]